MTESDLCDRKVEVVMSTYNGEAYIVQQLDSILRQTYKHLLVTIRDDGSTDGTVDIISGYVSRFPDKVRLVGGYENLGSTNSFLKALEFVNDDSLFFMFADQDDVWLEDKVEKSLAKMTEEGVSACFTDLAVVGPQLQILSPSMMGVMKIKPEELVVSPEKLLALNPVAGCTLIFNRKILGLVEKFGFPPRGLYHDHWIAVIASLYGGVCYLSDSTVLYRQHELNQVGSLDFSLRYLLGRMVFVRLTLLRDFKVILRLRKGSLISIIKYIFFKVFYNLKRVFRGGL